MLSQHHLQLPPLPKGCHLITRDIEACLGPLPDTGLLHVLIQHTSAALTLNENADPSVRQDFKSFLEHLVPENHPLYTHVFEGADDMPAHLLASLIGSSVTIPVSKGRLDLGTWQGIYLCEFRRYGGSRRLVLTLSS